GGGPTTSTVVATTLYFESRSLNWSASCGVNPPPIYPSRERKQLEKPRSWTRRIVASGALNGLTSSPKAIGLRLAEFISACDGDGRRALATIAEEEAYRNARRSIKIPFLGCGAWEHHGGFILH